MTDACSLDAKPLLGLPEALAKIQSAIKPSLHFERLPLTAALGRVLSESVYAPIDLPFDRNAAMDGYAFFSGDHLAGQTFALDLAGTSWAGRPYSEKLLAGQCIQIFTGAVVPEWADSVIMQEEVVLQGKSIVFPANTRCGQNIRQPGEDLKKSDLVCEAPKLLTANDISLLAAVGVPEVTVTMPLKIIFFSTGDELTNLGQPLTSGKIYDSNRYLLHGLLAGSCYHVVDGGVLPDNLAVIEATLKAAAETFDVIITTGGASVGAADFIKMALARLGQINFWKLAIKPGKPLAFGNIGTCHFFGLPGNPVAVLVTFRQLVAPALRQLAGAPTVKPLQLSAICTTALKKKQGRLEFQRGVLSQDDSGNFFVASAGKQDSHILSATSRANCFIVLPADCGDVQCGAAVMVEPFDVFI